MSTTVEVRTHPGQDSDHETALRVLREAYGQQARFRSGQWEAVGGVLEPGRRRLVVERTGWGKSIVYFLATRILRARGAGPTLLVSPLLSLMRNQVETAQRFKIRAESINSTNADDWGDLERAVLRNEVDLLLVAPERLSNARYVERLLPHLEKTAGLLVIDEAHCISDWGHDFRPDYRRIIKTVRRLSPQARVLGTTATANDRVIADIREQFGGRLDIQRGPLMRESLVVETHEIGDQAERLAWLARHVPELPGSGIIYTLTVNDARRVADWLREQGIQAAAYYADLGNDIRVTTEESFLGNRLKVLVATTALGMGYDKADVGFVIHFQRPGSIIAYYQQIGRAGRALDTAHAILLTGEEDDEISNYFIDSAFPPPRCFLEILDVLGDAALSLNEVVSRLNWTKGQVEKALKLLEVEEAVSKSRNGTRDCYTLVNARWHPDQLRAEQITSQRRAEMEQMKTFIGHEGCRMEFLARALDDPSPAACGRCDRCRTVARDLPGRPTILDAIRFLKRDHQVIQPRKRLPVGGDRTGEKNMPKEDLLLPGRTLCVYNDAGWGRAVREGKYLHGRFGDDLVDAAAAIIRELPTQPEWLTWIPSQRRTHLVPDFTRRLAQKLSLPALEAVRKVADNPEQKTMQNSSKQFENVWTAFAAVPSSVQSGVCLLVDDVVDSAWTMTAVGIHLRRAGCSGVIPFALATAKPRE